ncbi:16S rRNA (cytosine(967)-C(5))-methyltransferase [Leptolyngbya sp. FACHB-36]|uniref:16S rRNA (cytosine(967)-C(5))-methyltransferase n=1 Tax=Leptolyngbya sp. FACHB-36 TaxID=2692808 RepID=UPI0016804ED7|nr:16S rRNA (cytosine(967)-C(5))-methyltransferase [Leptolyngbya sp. FACHB-36]
MAQSSRQLAFWVLRSVQKGAFADVALDKALQQADLKPSDRGLLTELVYGCIRRQRTLDALIDQFAQRKAQPPDLRLILQVGLYQLIFLQQIPVSAAVNTTVDLAKQAGFPGLSGFVNGLLRQVVRRVEAEGGWEHLLPSVANPVEQLGVQHSYPDWIVQVWLEQLGLDETERLGEWMNHPPHIDLRVNALRSTVETVESAFQAAGIEVHRVPHLPDALRLSGPVGALQALPGYEDGWWMVQDSSAQLVSYLVDPPPGSVVIDACAAPGGKTLHLAERMHDRGTVWACDRAASRLKRLQQNVERLGLQSIKPCVGDSQDLPQFVGLGDRVLLDVPCSGLGTLHRHADARWRQTPNSVQELCDLQKALLDNAATWVKPDGALVYSTCTLHPAENEQQIEAFLARHPTWQIEPPNPRSPPAAFVTSEGWVKVWSHRHDMDGFFMVRLRRSEESEEEAA